MMYPRLGEPLIAEEGAKLPELLPVCISFSLALLVLVLLLLHLRARNANECIKSRLWHLACRDKDGTKEQLRRRGRRKCEIKWKTLTNPEPLMGGTGVDGGKGGN